MRGFALIAAISFLASPALAQDHKHPPQHAALHDEFYEGWMRPDLPTASCCNKQDCAPVAAVRHNTAGKLEALREKDGVWVEIPPEKIEWNRDSPDGRSHMCSDGPFIYCFVYGTGG